MRHQHVSPVLSFPGHSPRRKEVVQTATHTRRPMSLRPFYMFVKSFVRRRRRRCRSSRWQDAWCTIHMSLCPKSSKSGADFPKKGNPIINRLRVRKLSVDLCNSSIIMCFYWECDWAIELLWNYTRSCVWEFLHCFMQVFLSGQSCQTSFRQWVSLNISCYLPIVIIAPRFLFLALQKSNGRSFHVFLVLQYN